MTDPKLPKWARGACRAAGAAAVVELPGAVGAQRDDAERGEGAPQQPGRRGAEQGAPEAVVAARDAPADAGTDDLANHDFLRSFEFVAETAPEQCEGSS